MNILTRRKVAGKPAIKNRKAGISFLLVLLIFSQCKYRAGGSDKDAVEEENGYLMEDGSGYYFLKVNNADASSFKDNFMNGKDVTGFKFTFNSDSIDLLPLHYDTLVDLNKQEKGFPSAYVYKRIAPVKIVYSADSITEPYLKGMLSFPIRFDKGEFTLVYKPAGVKVIKITPVEKN